MALTGLLTSSYGGFSKVERPGFFLTLPDQTIGILPRPNCYAEIDISILTVVELFNAAYKFITFDMIPRMNRAKPVKSTLLKNAPLTNAQRQMLYEHAKSYPLLSQQELRNWFYTTHGLKISQGTVSDILKKSGKYLRGVDCADPERKRNVAVKHPEMEASLLEWFLEYQGRVNMSDNTIKGKATQLLGDRDPSFKYSNGWLEGFKNRNNIKEYIRFGSIGMVDMEVVEEARPALIKILGKYAPRDIYNVDETALFYRMEADKSLATLRLRGRRKAKERITLALCCNADGSDKLPSWIIGPFQKPRCFRNQNIGNLGCTYHWNKMAWMTGLIFVQWLEDFDKRMRRENRRVILLLDNFSGHLPSPRMPHPRLENTELLFLPPNSTLVLQPLDAGIIQNFKIYYRRRYNRHILQCWEGIRKKEGERRPSSEKTSEPGNISLLEAIKMSIAAWKFDIKERTIEDCFKHCWIMASDPSNRTDNNFIDETARQELRNVVDKIHYRNPMDIQFLINHPAEQAIGGALDSDGDLAGDQQEAGSDTNEDEDEDGNGDDDSEEIPTVPLQAVHSMAESMETFFLQQKGDYRKEIEYVQKLKDVIDLLRQTSLVQTQIMDFFKSH